MVITGDLKINFVYIRKCPSFSYTYLVAVSSIKYSPLSASCNDCILFWITTLVTLMGGNTIKWQMYHSRVRQVMGTSQQTLS